MQSLAPANLRTVDAERGQINSRRTTFWRNECRDGRRALMSRVALVEHLCAVLATSDTLPYAVVAASVSLGIALAAGLLAFSVKGRTGLPRLKPHKPPPFPAQVLGRPRRQVSLRDMTAARLSSVESGEAGAVQAPASIDPSSGPSSSLPEFDAASPLDTASPKPSPAVSNGSAGSALPQDGSAGCAEGSA